MKKWKDVKVGDVMRDGSIVTQIHGTHNEPCCKVVYGRNNQEFICSYNHILQIDISKLPTEAKAEVERVCTTVPLEESIRVDWLASDSGAEEYLTPEEMAIIEQFCRNEEIRVTVDCFNDDDKLFKDVVYGEVDTRTYFFNFKSGTKKVLITPFVTKEEPQRIDENTYWLPCTGIEYLLNKYKAKLKCNGLVIKSVTPVGYLPCFCISTNTGKYET